MRVPNPARRDDNAQETPDDRWERTGSKEPVHALKNSLKSIRWSVFSASGAKAVVLGLLLVVGPAKPLYAGEPVNEQRARFDYMLNCQGCHLPRGEGAGDVPRMTGFVGNFLKVPGGREFLVQVPGSANAALDDARLAELLNWMLAEISREQLPAGFRPYTAEEVGRYRAMPLHDVLETRAQLIQKIATLRH